jgi:hypothetical protein
MSRIKPIMVRFVLLANLLAQHLKALRVSRRPAGHLRQPLFDSLD